MAESRNRVRSERPITPRTWPADLPRPPLGTSIAVGVGASAIATNATSLGNSAGPLGATAGVTVLGSSANLTAGTVGIYSIEIGSGGTKSLGNYSIAIGSGDGAREPGNYKLDGGVSRSVALLATGNNSIGAEFLAPERLVLALSRWGAVATANGNNAGAGRCRRWSRHSNPTGDLAA